ncbi:STAS domain-containing protein [Dechloromonas denitrificans]|uniref:STAS domain-containing protein n=1 Tax=Dechloromonas denitrificans TaxID=281362 RepID=UPI0008298D27|nr:STAS domain-containing protein [Dechloromonas denitrificans]
MASKFIQIKESADEWQLALPPVLDFAAARQLLRQIRELAPGQTQERLCLDFSQTRQIDTAGLGSLLLIGEHFGAKTKFRLAGATGMVRELLDVAGIEQHLARLGTAGTRRGEAGNYPPADHRQAPPARAFGSRI